MKGFGRLQIINNYKVSSGQICIMSCIRDIFRLYGNELTEAMIFAFAEASLFYYKHLNIEEDSFSDKITRVFDFTMGGMKYNIPEMLQNIADYLNTEIDIEVSREVGQNIRFIEKHINGERPVLSFLSRKNLDYMEKKFRDDITHSINIIGYDWSDNSLYIADSYIPTSPVTTYVGKLQFEQYYKSIIDSQDIFRQKFEFRSIAFVQSDMSNINFLCTEMLLTPLRNMGNQFFEKNVLQNGVLSGKQAYSQFVSDCKQWMNEFETLNISKIFRLIHNRLTNYGGVVVTNHLLSQYTQQVLRYNQNKDLEQLRVMLEECEKKWFIIANLFGKYSFQVNCESMENLYTRIKEVVHLEENIHSLMRRL